MLHIHMYKYVYIHILYITLYTYNTFKTGRENKQNFINPNKEKNWKIILNIEQRIEQQK